jgi:phage terminase small subunit
MPELKNPRHERFAQLLVEGRNREGRPITATDAHERAGYKRNDGNASTLAQNPDVQARIKELKGIAAAETVVNAKTLIGKAEAVYQRAYETGQYSAANGAIKEMGVLSGVRIERAEIGGPGEFDHLSDDELWRLVVERFEQLKAMHEGNETTIALNGNGADTDISEGSKH